MVRMLAGAVNLNVGWQKVVAKANHCAIHLILPGMCPLSTLYQHSHATHDHLLRQRLETHVMPKLGLGALRLRALVLQAADEIRSLTPMPQSTVDTSVPAPSGKSTQH